MMLAVVAVALFLAIVILNEKRCERKQNRQQQFVDRIREWVK